MPPDQLIAQLEAGNTPLAQFEYAFYSGTPDGFGRVGSRGEYTDQERDQLLNALHRNAAFPNDGSEVGSRVLRASYTALQGIGISLWGVAPEANRVPRMVLDIYEQTGSRASRALAVHVLGWFLALEPDESLEIEALLFELAAGPRESQTDPLPEDAIFALLKACRMGVPTLQRLHDGRLVHDPMWGAILRDIAESGFPEEAFLQRRLGRPCPE